MTTREVIRVLAFGSAVEVLGWTERELPWTADLSVGAVVARLEADCPRLIEGRGKLRFAVNQAYATPDRILAAGDELALIPPIAGGDVAEPVACRLVHEPIDVPDLLAAVGDPSCGAVNLFVGVVRAETNSVGQSLAALEYSAYEPMALREMRALCGEVAERHALHQVRLVHRLGRLAIQDAAVAMVTVAPHRAASFDGCRAILEQLKQRVPIFKKELWADGRHSWVEPNPG